MTEVVTRCVELLRQLEPRQRTHARRAIAARMGEVDETATPDVAPLAALSGRERQVFGLLVEGLTNRQVAEVLSISIKTVDTHRQHILQKLNVHSLVAVVRVAAEAGWFANACACRHTPPAPDQANTGG